jgi:hypothetical protein
MESSALKRQPTLLAFQTSPKGNQEKGTSVGNWLMREQANELLTVPDRSKIKGKRDYAILALLLGCAVRRQELASLDVDGIEMRRPMGLSRSLWEGRPSFCLGIAPFKRRNAILVRSRT